MNKKSSPSLNQKKKLKKTAPQNKKTETETATGFGDKKLEGPDRPST